MDRFRLRVWNNKTKEFVDPMDWSYWDMCFWYEPYKRDIEPINELAQQTLKQIEEME